MSNIGRIPEVTRDDVRALVAKVGDGTFTSAHMYREYFKQMLEQDRPAVTQNALSRALRDACQRPTNKSVDGRTTRCWVVRQKFLEWIDPETAETVDRG